MANGYISKITLPNNSTYEIKDISARAAIDRKIYIDGLSTESLCALHVGQDDFFQKVMTSALLSNELYIVSSSYINAYGQQIKNLSTPTALSDAATKEYVDNAISDVQIPTDLSAFTNSPGYLVSNDISDYYKKSETSSSSQLTTEFAKKLEANDVNISYSSTARKIVLTSKTNTTSVDCNDFIKDGMLSTAQLCGTTLVLTFNTDASSQPISVELSSFVDNYDSKISDLSAAIDGKITIDDRLSNICQQSDLSIVKLNASDYEELVTTSATLSNALYIVEDEFEDAYGQQIKNVAPGTDLSDAVNLEQLSGAISSIQIPTDLSAFTNSPGYLVSNDISGYYKKSETSSASEISNALSAKAEISSLAQYLALSGGTLSSGAVIHFGNDWLLSTGINPTFTNYKELKISASNGQTWTFDDSGDPDGYGDGSFVIRDGDLYNLIGYKVDRKADLLPFAQTFEDLTEGEPERHMWSEDSEYSVGDTVAYEGRFYSCNQDADSSHPPTDTDYWSEIPYSFYAQYNGFSMMNVTWEMLVGMRTAGILFPGTKYRITDYVTTIDQTDCSSAMHPFDLIVTAIDHHTLDEHATATLPSNGDDYFDAREFHIPDYQQYLEYARVPLESWDIKYCLDNDKTRFKFADTENGKGVIYYMKDEFGNEAPYDFKNVQFKRYKITSSPRSTNLEGMYGLAVSDIEVDTSDEMWCYTFNGADYEDFGLNEPYDFSGWHVRPTQAVLQQFGGPSVERLQECTENMIQARQQDENDFSQMSFKLPNNVFHCALTDTPVSELPFLKVGYCGENKLGLNCYDNTFGHSQLFNIFGNNCYSNTFGHSCYGNVFSNSCNSNVFGDDCYSNTFGYGCYNNTFGSDCDSNTLGDNCYSNSIGSDGNGNVFGNYCRNNVFGDICDSNTFSDDCDSNALGDRCSGNVFGAAGGSNTFGSDCNSNTFGDNCSYIKFASANINDPSQAKSYYKYITVDGGNQYIILYCSQSTYSGHEYKNVRILPGVNNTTTWKTITDSNVNQSFCTTYQPANSQVIAI